MIPRKTIGSRLPASLLMAVLVAHWGAGPASAALTADETKCRSAIATFSGAYVKTIGQVISSCHAARDSGDAAYADKDCNNLDDADVNGAAAKSASTSVASIVAACGTLPPSVLAEFKRCPSPQETVDDGDATDGIDDFSEVAECLNAHARAVVSGGASGVLGLPARSALPLNAELAKCHAGLSKAYTKYVSAVIKLRSKCQKAADKVATAPDFVCETSDPGGKIANAAEKAKKLIAKACSTVAPLNKRGARATAISTLGACAGDLTGLTQCAIDETATTAATGAAAMIWELPGICPGSGAMVISPETTETEADIGFSGLAHDMDPVLGFRGVNFGVTCDPDCSVCSTTNADPTPAPNSCRCANDNATICGALLPNGSSDCPSCVDGPSAGRSCDDNADCSTTGDCIRRCLNDSNHTPCASNSDCAVGFCPTSTNSCEDGSFCLTTCQGTCTGAAACECFWGPPASYVAGGTPACVTTKIRSAISGSAELQTGAIDLTLPLRAIIYLGGDTSQPCPVCRAGVCDGGDRDGLPCKVDATDATFGSLSYDCLPSAGSNISGSGLKSTLHLTTGAVSLDFGTKCSVPYDAQNCACASCSTDSSVACNSNSDCGSLPKVCTNNRQTTCNTNTDCNSVNAGPCNTFIGRCQGYTARVCTSNTDCNAVNVGPCETPSCTGGDNRLPNDCSGGTCTAVLGEPGEGECVGDDYSYCSGLTRSNGKGIIPCQVDSDCALYQSGSPDPANWVCENNDCGTCSLLAARECFLDPIAATGAPGEKLVGTGCFAASANSAVNMALGLPGAYRVQQKLGPPAPFCSDGFTPFIPPGGSNCPP